MTVEERALARTKQKKKWRSHLKAQARSGLSRAEYCRQQNLSYHAFFYWQRKLASSLAAEPSTASVLVPIALTSSRPSEPELHPPSMPVGLHLLLPGRVTVAIGDSFSAAALDRLLTVLEGR